MFSRLRDYRDRRNRRFAEARAEGIEQGLEQGLEQGIEQGLEQGIQQGIQLSIESTLAILKTRFPDADINALKPKLEAITDLDLLKALNLNASIAHSNEAFQERLRETR